MLERSYVLYIDGDKESEGYKYPPLEGAIDDVFIPAQTSTNARKHAHATIANIVNEKALGVTVAQYRANNNIDGKDSIRDCMTEGELVRIKISENHVYGLIIYGGVTSCNDLINRLGKITTA